MGTLRYSLSNYGPDNNKNLIGTRTTASGAETTSASAGDISGLSVRERDVLRVITDTASWVDFGGRTAAVGSGLYLPADIVMDFEVSIGDAGAVSVIEG